MANMTQSNENLYRPRDVQLQHILLNRVVYNNNHPRIPVLDIYDYEPSELPNYGLRTDDQEWCFFCPRNGTNRLTKNGYWKITGKGSKIKHRNIEIGTKRILVFYSGRCPNGKSTDWKMHEYIVPTNMYPSNQQDYFVLCKVIDRSNDEGDTPSYESDSNGAPCDDAYIYDQTGFYSGGTSQFATTENQGTCDRNPQQPEVGQNYTVASPFTVWPIQTDKQCLDNVLSDWERFFGVEGRDF